MIARRRLPIGILLAAALVAAVGGVESQARQVATTAPLAPAQVPAPRTLIKYIVGASIPIPASAGTGFFDRGLAVDATGNLYVGHDNSATSGPDIAVLSPQGNLLRQWSAAPGVGGAFGPVIAIGPDGLVYVQNGNEVFIRVFTPTGAEVRRLQHGSQNTGDIEVDAAGNVYLSSRGGPSAPGADDGVIRFNSAGQITGYLVPRPGEGPDDALRGLAVAGDGSVYITTGTGFAPKLFHLDASGNRLPVFDPNFTLPGNYRDVELANGRLYFWGAMSGPAKFDHTKVAAAVFTPQGGLVDYTVGRPVTSEGDEQLAVFGERMYVQGLAASTTSKLAGAGGIVILDGFRMDEPSPGDSQGTIRNCGNGWVQNDLLVPLTFVNGGDADCQLAFHNFANPCEEGGIARGGQVFLGGEPAPATVLIFPGGPPYGYVELPPGGYSSGSVVVRFICQRPTDPSPGGYETYEWKGEIVVRDPSGNVLDARTGRPVEAATVRLQFSLKQNGPFGRPGTSGFRPQVNPQVTGRNGAFAWHVAEGFWRLRITAYGYRPFTSPVYKVPPEVTGLKLRLRQNPAQQRTLIDAQAGRAGVVRLGSKTRRAAGLLLRRARGRVRGITVRSRRFRTIHGVRIGSPSRDLLGAYPPTRAMAQRFARANLVRYRVAKATFTVRRDRVVAITLGR